MRKMFIVWNEQRNEGFVTDEWPDAQYALTGKSLPGTIGNSTAAEAFRDVYNRNLTLEEVELP